MLFLTALTVRSVRFFLFVWFFLHHICATALTAAPVRATGHWDAFGSFVPPTGSLQTACERLIAGHRNSRVHAVGTARAISPCYDPCNCAQRWCAGSARGHGRWTFASPFYCCYYCLVAPWPEFLPKSARISCCRLL